MTSTRRSWDLNTDSGSKVCGRNDGTGEQERGAPFTTDERNRGLKHPLTHSVSQIMTVGAKDPHVLGEHGIFELEMTSESRTVRPSLQRTTSGQRGTLTCPRHGLVVERDEFRIHLSSPILSQTRQCESHSQSPEEGRPEPRTRSVALMGSGILGTESPGGGRGLETELTPGRPPGPSERV